jgi:RimJ/RimL family protein N-acetyltransferase
VAGEATNGDGVVLRPTSQDDLPFLREFFADPDVYRYWGGAPLADVEIRAKYLGRRSPAVECFIVEKDGQDAGYAQLHVADDGGEGGGMDLVLGRVFRGRGIGTAVVMAVVGYVRSYLGWQRFPVDPDADNIRGVAFWTKVGFTPVRLIDGEDGREPYWIMECPAPPD